MQLGLEGNRQSQRSGSKGGCSEGGSSEDEDGGTGDRTDRTWRLRRSVSRSGGREKEARRRPRWVDNVASGAVGGWKLHDDGRYLQGAGG